MISPKIINIKKFNLIKLGYRDLEHWLENPKHKYIGRDMSFYIKGAKGSKFANLYPVKKYGRDKCLEMFENNLRNSLDLCNSIKELEGCILGCFCKPEPCHGDIIIKIFNEKFNN